MEGKAFTSTVKTFQPFRTTTVPERRLDEARVTARRPTFCPSSRSMPATSATLEGKEIRGDQIGFGLAGHVLRSLLSRGLRLFSEGLALALFGTRRPTHGALSSTERTSWERHRGSDHQGESRIRRGRPATDHARSIR